MTRVLRWAGGVVCLLSTVAVADAGSSSVYEALRPVPLGSVEDASASAHPWFPDVVLLDQDGNERKFFTDLLQGKVVAIQSFFTSCENSCPIITSRFAKLQDRLGDRLGREVHLISISVDPKIDTPQKLKAYANKLGAKPGWHFVAGDNVHFVLCKLGLYAQQPDQHKNTLIV